MMRLNRLPGKGMLPHRHRSILRIIFESTAIGIIAGFIVVLFRLSLEHAESMRHVFFDAMRSGNVRVFLMYVPLVLGVGLFLGWTAVRWPLVKGSGIPQIKGALMGRMRLSWLPELPLKVIGGVLSLGFGLSLGREGPSIQIGAFAGKGFMNLARRPQFERRYLITAGAAAGLSAAFSAPLAGVLFVLEELHRSFSPLMLACAMCASIAGDLVASGFFGLRPVFDFHRITPLGLSRLPFILILGVFSALVGDLFKRALYAAQDLYDALRVPPLIRPALALLCAIPVCWFLFDVSGGGHELIMSLAHSQKPFAILLALLAAKILFTAVSYGSGAPGGIFLPLLACGALLGELFGTALNFFSWATPEESLNYLIIGMAAFFTGVVRAPVTGAVLIVEMSGNFNHFAGLISGCLAAFVFGDLIKSRGAYDVLLARIVRSVKKK